MENQAEAPRALTLTNLLILMCFVLALQSVFMPVHQAAAGPKGYFVGIPFGIIYAVVSGYLEWQALSRLVVWLKEGTALNILGMVVLIGWLPAAGFLGVEIGTMIVKGLFS